VAELHVSTEKCEINRYKIKNNTNWKGYKNMKGRRAKNEWRCVAPPRRPLGQPIEKKNIQISPEKNNKYFQKGNSMEETTNPTPTSSS